MVAADGGQHARIVVDEGLGLFAGDEPRHVPGGVLALLDGHGGDHGQGVSVLPEAGQVAGHLDLRSIRHLQGVLDRHPAAAAHGQPPCLGLR